MNNRMQQVGQFALDTVRESARQTMNNHGDDRYRAGFTRAAGITLRRVQEKLDAFREQMKGAGLTKAEQTVYAQLEELKSEVEADYDRYWRDSGVDWRPPTPMAKGTVRRREESKS